MGKNSPQSAVSSIIACRLSQYIVVFSLFKKDSFFHELVAWGRKKRPGRSAEASW